MKIILNILIILLTFFLFTVACKKDKTAAPTPPKKLLSIGLGGGFADDSVQVKLNNEEIYNDVVIIDTLLGIGKNIYFNEPAQRYQSQHIEVLVSSTGAHADVYFKVEDTISVGIGFVKSENRIMFVIYDYIQKYE